MADPLEAILASMAAATGNMLPPDNEKKEETSKSSKRAREDDAELDPNDEKSSIWNRRAMQLVPHDVLQNVQTKAKACVVTPPAEIARQQTVRQLCNKIKRAGEQMGIAKLPNSTYETWQFTSKLTIAENDPLIPHAGSDYSGLFEELVKAGATRSSATKQCKALTKESERLLRKFTQQDFSMGKKKVKTDTTEDMMVLSYGSASAKVSPAHYQKLKALYCRHQRVQLQNAREKQAFDAALFCLLLRYDSLDGGGFQAALNEECFDVLLRHFDCKMECFASPFNCRYGRFCSAFLDTDAAFGSLGSFFEFAPTSGCYEANPPFIPKLIKRMADHMATLLDASSEALAFIIIIPAWTETDGWQTLHNSRYNRRHVRLQQKDHGYCEGKQQIRKTRWRIASFDTSIFFWQNAKAATKWTVTDAIVEELKRAFQSKQAAEREQLGLRNSGKRVRVAKS